MNILSIALSIYEQSDPLQLEKLKSTPQKECTIGEMCIRQLLLEDNEFAPLLQNKTPYTITAEKVYALIKANLTRNPFFNGEKFISALSYTATLLEKKAQTFAIEQLYINYVQVLFERKKPWAHTPQDHLEILFDLLQTKARAPHLPLFFSYPEKKEEAPTCEATLLIKIALEFDDMLYSLPMCRSHKLYPQTCDLLGTRKKLASHRQTVLALGEKLDFTINLNTAWTLYKTWWFKESNACIAERTLEWVAHTLHFEKSSPFTENELIDRFERIYPFLPTSSLPTFGLTLKYKTLKSITKHLDCK